MEYLLAAAVALSVTLNVLLVWHMLRHTKVGAEHPPCELLQFEPVDSGDFTVTSLVEPESDPVVKEEQPTLQASNHQAWTNKKNIPWCELDRPKQEPVRTKRSDPLGRPPGFYR